MEATYLLKLSTSSLRYWLGDSQICCLYVIVCIRADHAFETLQPAWKSACCHFCIDIWTRTLWPSSQLKSFKQLEGTHRNQPNPRFSSGFKEGLVSKYALCSELSLLSLKKVPVDVERHSVVSERLDLFEKVKPQRRHGKPSIVLGSCSVSHLNLR